MTVLIVEILHMRKGAFKISAIYVVCGVLWIVLSDKLLDSMQGYISVSLIFFISSIKGFAYVLLTGLMLYKLVCRHGKRLIVKEKQYRSYFEDNPTPMWIFNRRTFRFVEVNRAAEESYGYSPEEFKAMTIFDIRPENERPKLNAFINSRWEIYRDLGTWTHQKKDGTIIYVQINSQRFVSGNHENIMVMARDVTSIKHLEDEKNEYLLRLEDTLNSISDAFFTLDANWTISSANPVFEVISGFKKSKAVGQKLTDIWPDVTNEPFFDYLNKALSWHTTERFEAYSPYLKKWLRFSCYPTKKGLAVYFVDCSEVKEKDLMLKKALERYDLAAMATGDMVYEFDFINNRASFSKSHGTLSCINLADREDASSDWLDLIHPEDAAAVTAALSKAMAARRPKYAFSYRVNCGEDGFRYVSDQASIVYGLKKKPLRMIGAIRDINDLKEKEASLYKQNEILREIAWIESHEIRRPLASIMALVNLITDENSEADKQQLLELLSTSAAELDDMIRKISTRVGEIATDINA